jgi:carbonic anhydrase
LVVVLGHEGCGAIHAALEAKYAKVQHRSRIQLLVDTIVPVLEGLDAGLSPADLLARAVETNVRRTVQTILDSPEGRARQAEGRVRIVGAIYDIETGRVRFLEGTVRTSG